jgi:hypothetical protein
MTGFAAKLNEGITTNAAKVVARNPVLFQNFLCVGK